MGKVREAYLDLTKFLAIFLVIVHHVRDYAADESVYAGMAWVENLSSIFGVVVFFAVSGYLSRGLMWSFDGWKLVRRVVILLWPILPVLCLGEVQSLVLFGAPFIPPCGWVRYVFTIGWFFFCLALCEVMTFASFFLSRGRPMVLLAALGTVFVALGMVPVGLFHALEMIPAYWVGLFVLPWLLSWRWSGVMGLVLLTLSLVVFVALGDLRECGLSYYVVTTHFLDFSVRGFLLLLARYAISVVSVCGVILTVRLVAQAVPVVEKLAFLGTQTLGVFYVHMLVLTDYYARIGWTGGGLVGRFALALAVFLLSQGLVIMTRRSRLLEAILWNPLALFPSRKA